MTPTHLSTIITNIQQNIIPDFAQEDKGLLSFFSFGKGKLMQEFENLIANSQNPQFAKSLRGVIYQLLDNKTPVYQFSSEELSERIKNLYPLSSGSNYYFSAWILTLMNHHWVKGERHLIIRLLVFFMGYRTDNNFDYQKQLLENIPDECQTG